MKRKLLIIGAIIAISPMLFSFCGFYVSKADGTLKNKTSQVILVRDGNKTSITMYNDFKGDTKDFAQRHRSRSRRGNGLDDTSIKPGD